MIAAAKSSSAWKQFWAHDVPAAHHSVRSPASTRTLREHWRRVLRRQLAPAGHFRLLDAACGDGEVAALAQRCAQDLPECRLSLHCLDLSEAAVASAARASAGMALPTVGDGAKLPFADSVFGCVVSQFGLEYAGFEAFSDAARVADGQFHAVVHMTGGAIERECQHNLVLLNAVAEAGVLRRLSYFVGLNARLLAGGVAPKAVGRSRASLVRSLGKADAALGAAQPGAARNFVARLLNDCRTVAGAIERYSPTDLQTWIDVQAGELDAFRHRMVSMIDAAVGEEGVREIAERLRCAGTERIEIAKLETAEGTIPLAWAIGTDVVETSG